MTDLDVVAFVTRGDLTPPQADLNLNDGETYTLAQQFRPGGVTWRKESVESPFVHGRLVTNEVKQSTEGSLGVYVAGSTHTELHSNIEQLLLPFVEQRSYIVGLAVEGEEMRWKCERADFEVGITTAHLASLYVPVALSFHRHPIPVEGTV